MVNFNDPDVIDKEYWEIGRLWCFLDGILIWEIVNTLDYEWSVIRGRRPYRWTIWLYSLTRVATLAAVALNSYTLLSMAPVNCEVTINLQFIWGYIALASSLLLIVLRIIAIWNRNKIIVALATGVWLTTIAFLIQGVSRFSSSMDAVQGCVMQLNGIRLSTIAIFSADIILLLIMLFGLYRLRRHDGSLIGLGCLLWNQGVVWLLLAVTAELPPMVLIILDLNPPLNIMLQIPWVITMSIAAARMYRTLTDFLSSDVPQIITPISGRITFENNGTTTAPILLTGIQVAVHETREQDGGPQANHFGSNFNGQLHEKPHELAMAMDLVCDHDLERGAENRVM